MVRFIVYGVGAVGGVIAASLILSGHEVVGIARGRMLDAINRDGLRLRTPLVDERVRFRCVAAPADVGFAEDDVILLTMKSQDTQDALEALAAAGVDRQAILCAQNGVENERAALRRFPNVYGLTVMTPAAYTEPGEVMCHAIPKRGLFDIGRYPSGTDDTVRAIAAAFNASEFDTLVYDDIMRSKYRKLIDNQGNIVRATLGYNADLDRYIAIIREEAQTVLTAAGIDWHPLDTPNERRDLMKAGEIAGTTRPGDSSSQSLLRGTGSLETDFLNGEISLLGRLHGVPTPAADFLCRLARRMVRDGLKPGDISPTEYDRGFAGEAAA